jgi:hypothetical protein
MARFRFYGMLLLLMAAVGVWAQADIPPEQPERPIYTALRTDVAPVVREGRTFVPLRAIAEQFNAQVTWLPATRQVSIVRPNAPNIRLTVGEPTALVGDQQVALDVAPFIRDGRTLVPLRFIAETYQVPVSYNPTTRSVRLTRENRIYVLPLESLRAGIYIYDPQPGELVRNPVRVQGQANVFEGALTVEVQDDRGRVLGRTIATAGMGGFYPFSVPIYYNLPSEDPVRGKIVVYSQNGRGDGRILARDEVDVVLASTI